MNLHGFTIGVCSWSLHPASAEDLVRQVKSVGLGHVQIALAPLIDLDEADRRREIKILLDSGLEFTGGMIGFPGEDYSTIENIRRTGGIVPDALWPERRRRLQAAAEIATKLGLSMIASHVGFIPPLGDPRRPVIDRRIGDVVEILSAAHLRLLMETGQESAHELAAFLVPVDAIAPGAVGINFDPANMILYGAGDPTEAVGILGKWIGHVHVKDGIASTQPGEEWGEEVAFGAGQVGASAFLRALKSVGYSGPLAIEREAGATRQADVIAAIAALREARI